MRDIKLGNNLVGMDKPCFIIAELSANHLHDYDIAVKTIQKMKEAGADCVKLQTARPESITLDCTKPDFIVGGGTAWDGRALFDLYKETNTPWDWHEPLKRLVEDLGMVFFSSPFDFEAIDFLEKLNVPAFKIASFEITDIPLIKYAASKHKPMIISTGIATLDDIKDAVHACLSEGNDQIVLLKCTSAYPTPLAEVNLNMIPTIRNEFNCHVGLSDHTLCTSVPLGAVALGAKVIEKHFILDRMLGGPDAAFSLQPEEFKSMVNSVRDLEQALGKSEIAISEKVELSRQFARSLYVVQDVKKGEVFTDQNFRSIRPGYGIKPKYYYDIVGKTARANIERGTRLTWDLISE
ncbi:MAG: pseudaminic acid synthase [Prolixibacteraceae bacterium]|jgi:pseudaminic acid synthase|nr:pseudaminic acid synthase [Prolixibacteraceae bacterium]